MKVMRTFLLLICSLALACVAHGAEKNNSHKQSSGKTQAQAPHHVAKPGGYSAGAGAHAQHTQAPQHPARPEHPAGGELHGQHVLTSGGHPAGGGVIRPTSHPETAPGGNATAKPASQAPPAPVYHYNFRTKSGLTGLDFTRPLTPQEQSTIERQIANGQPAGTQAPPGVAPASEHVGAGAAAAREAEIEDAKRRGAVITDRATKLAPSPAQAKANPFHPQHLNLPSKPDAGVPSVKFQGSGHIPASETWIGKKYEVFCKYHHEWHDSDWWKHRHDRIILVSGGWYFSHAGYWYPAWGYDRANSYYPYDGPIYGYSGLAPDQVIANVQAALQTLGYYNGPVNGLLGPLTREALANYQRDHGLYTTSAIDESTLASLGMA